MPENKALIIDYGSQVTQLIARRVREAGVYSEVLPAGTPEAEIRARDPGALILSGGPASVADPGAPVLDPALLELGVPILGICYGLQLLAHHLGGRLARSAGREYGPARLTAAPDPGPLFAGLPAFSRVWMSHGDQVELPPPGFKILAGTEEVRAAALGCEERRIYGVQFHPEVHHTEIGPGLIRNFLTLAGLTPDWNMASFLERAKSDLKRRTGQGRVVCALSGGVDSTVVAVLLHQVIGDRLHCFFVDHGLLRQGETAEVRAVAEHFGLNLTVVEAADLFLERLSGVEDPEQKRKIIGHTFIEVFEAEAAGLTPRADFLAQGTLYPDVIESISPLGPSAIIKSHHNVGGLPETMNLELIEPLRDLFKDEVRLLAAELGLPEDFTWRQPFPGPGLAIRVLGPVDKTRLDTLRRADAIVQAELKAAGLYRRIWQGFAVLLPLKTVGVMGDDRTYEDVVALRAVESVDAMTADWARLPYDFLETVPRRIINEVRGVNRVVYDISSKPPSTIEWE
jgi:GMP synthase (glutamine-hydrolysing)